MCVCVCVYGWLFSVAFTIVLLPLFSFVLLVCWLDGQSLDIILFCLFLLDAFYSLVTAQDGDDDDNEYYTTDDDDTCTLSSFLTI